jgi:hypothetical protein
LEQVVVVVYRELAQHQDRILFLVHILQQAVEQAVVALDQLQVAAVVRAVAVVLVLPLGLAQVDKVQQVARVE